MNRTDMKKLPNTKMVDMLGTLSENTANMVRHISESASEAFKKDGELHPFCFVVNTFGKVVITPVPMKDEKDKASSFENMRQIRSMCPTMLFIVETWMRHCEGKEWDGVLPSQSPDRKEMALLTLWEGRRTVSFYAPILREPNRLGEWLVMNDTMFSSKEEQVAGRMVEGQAMPTDSN